MSKTVPWTSDRTTDGARPASLDPTRRKPLSSERRDGNEVEEVGSAQRSSDHREEMRAIAAQLARLSDGGDSVRGRRDTSPAGPQRPEFRDAIRDAVAEIARRQADLDAHGAAPPSDPNGVPAAPSNRPRADSTMSVPVSEGPPTPSNDPAAPVASAPLVEPGSAMGLEHDRASLPPPTFPPVGPRRVGVDLSAEVSRTFARFSRDIQDSIRATDARPNIEALDHHMRRIGRAVHDLEGTRMDGDAIALIAEQTREMRDLLGTKTRGPVPLDGVERQVASLEARLGRLAEGVAPTAAPVSPPGFDDTMAEVRALLEGLKPGTAMTSLETRLDDITARIESGLEARGPAGLIEGLSRRVDEIHASLQTRLAQSAVDTRPLESLVRGLSDRIGEAREASTDFQQLELAVRDVTAKLDGAAAGVDPRGTQAIESQLGRLAERLERSEASLKAFDGIENSLGELFSQFEVTRQVAIDAAETAARTAARDTLRAALQNPTLTPRSSDSAPGLADQVSRGLGELRASQDSAERRTQTALLEIRATMERLAHGLGSAGRAVGDAGPVEPVGRRSAAPPLMTEAVPVMLDPVDILIEPGFGRGTSGSSSRGEPGRALGLDPGADRDGISPPEGDGPAQFIAAARRAAQAAQASAASEAAFMGGERRPTARGLSKRPGASFAGTMARAKRFLARRRRPVLLGLAALILLVGALEVVKLSVEPSTATRVATAETAAPARPAIALVPPNGSAPSATAKASALSEAVLPPAAAVRPPPLPSFVAGPAKAQPVAAVDGIPDPLRNRASAGEAAAQYEVGLRYAEGQGVVRDPRQAAAWFGKAAAQGLALAEYRLGSSYEKGVGVDRDPALAMGWYAKAADSGNVRAMHNLAVMSAEGAAGKPDYARAAQWFGKAATYGVRDSQFNLAILDARGLGIEQSLPQSYTWFAIAAAGGDEDAAKKRDEVAGKLDPAVLASAKAAADAFRPAVPTAAANEVSALPVGADVGPPRPASPSAKVSQL